MSMKGPSLVVMKCILAGCSLLLGCSRDQHHTGEATLRVAVASNFADTLSAVAARFEQESGHQLILIPGSTGKHYAQIHHGAPFDIFLAADTLRPELLQQEGLALPGTRFTYAVGKLVLWSPDEGVVDPAGKVLEQPDFRHLAIANPKLAPYGQAAWEVLQARGLWDALEDRLVRGENISQTIQFVDSGNAELGFVAWSQVQRPGRQPTGSWWEVPQVLYTPIEQQAVLLRDSPLARDFLAFLRSEEVRTILRDYGYGTP